MSHDTDDLIGEVVDLFLIWTDPPVTGIGCFFYALILAVVVGLVYNYGDKKDDACEAIAGAAYERIDGICYQKVNGNLIKVSK
jgi:hypothetical protein